MITNRRGSWQMNKVFILAPQKYNIQISMENMNTHDRVEKVKFT